MSLRRKVSDDFCSWLEGVIDSLGITQKMLSEKSGVTQPWLSQMLTGRRVDCDCGLMTKLKAGLKIAIESNSNVNERELLEAVEVEFSPFTDKDEVISDFSPEALRVAADALTLIIKCCPSKRMRQQVVKFLQVAVKQ